MNESSLVRDAIRFLITRLDLQKTGLKVSPEGCILPLLFHKAQKTLFADIITQLLDNNFHFISTDELVDILKRKIPLKKRSVWLSFDDGHRQNLEHVVPVLELHGIPTIYYLATVPIENAEGVPWVLLARENRALLPIPYEQLTTIPEQRRKEIIAGIQMAERKKLPRDLMTTTEVQALARLPFITIGSHTANHVVMPNCTPAELDREIAESSQVLEAWIGKKMQYFAYPFGFFNGQEQDVLCRHGYVLATTTQRAMIDMRFDKDINPFRIPRISMPGEGPLSKAIYHLGSTIFMHRVFSPIKALVE